MSTQICLLIILLLFFGETRSSENYELRIHEGAKSGVRMTMGIEFQRKMDGLKHCFGQLETSVEWIEFRAARSAFYTNEPVPYFDAKKAPNLEGTLHLLCTGNKMISLSFHVHITRLNRHPPTFVNGNDFTFYVPIDIRKEELGEIATLQVEDVDTVIYNSQRMLRFTKDQSLFTIESDGRLRLKSTLTSQQPYKPIHFEVLAIDFGSPQLHTIANVTVIPVTVSRVENLKVNVATDDYQIFEWDKPKYGVATKYRLTIRKGESILYEEEMDSKHTSALTKVPIDAGGDFSYQVTSVDHTGETPSEINRFSVIQNDLTCTGQCAQGGGIPLCHYGLHQVVQQYSDERGHHCHCYHGYSGNTCQYTDTCPAEKTLDVYGGLDWPETPVNSSVPAPCPYNHDGETLSRVCGWEPIMGRAVWQPALNAEKCVPQISLLTHLGMIGTFAGKADSTSTVHTVVRYFRKLLNVPAFTAMPDPHAIIPQAQSPAHFDQKIAEEVVQVVEQVLHVNISNLKGNGTQARADMWSVLRDFTFRLPVPMSLASSTHGLHLRANHWLAGADNYKTLVGASCYVKLSTIQKDNIIRSICMQNGTLFEMIDGRNPVLSLEVDRPLHNSFSRVNFGLRPPYQNTSDNYTCVIWDQHALSWSTRNIRRLSADDHGFVVCESSHLGVFALLPESLFITRSPLLSTLTSTLPTVTSGISVIVAAIFLFIAACQRAPSTDIHLLLLLFDIFLIHFVHLAQLIGPQIGDSYLLSPSVHLGLQFGVISATATLCLIVAALHSFMTSLRDHPTKEDLEEACCSRSARLVIFALVIPGVLTFITYHYSTNGIYDFSRVVERVEWLFIFTYLIPAVFFLSLAMAFAIWNIVLGNQLDRSTTPNSRCLAISPATSASISSLLLMSALTADVVLFILREFTITAVLGLSMAQIILCLAIFKFSGYLFRIRMLTECDPDGGSTRSLERKRDISRALLEHVDAKHTYGSDVDSVRSDSAHFLSNLTSNLYDRQPMVSIV
ncbi:unnamed protein product, partial [Mesorhabditis belari]|uniref:GPS domain-containing protein n=1 Tax=Mesorhabditis belari TaxID=2138241 RepID=A0AAF3EQN7_9BILA